MDRALKQRLIGAAVLVAIAVIFLPMLVKGPAPVSGAADVSLDVPTPPQDGFETRDLPLGAPGQVPAGGVAGMSDAPVAGASQPAAAAIEPASTPATAAGDFAVNFGHYGSSADADRMVAALAQSQLKAYAEPATLNGRSAWRVRLGPYAGRAEAEAARLRALHVSDKVNASVIALNAGADVAPAATTAATPPAAVTTAPLPPAPGTAESAAPTPKPVQVAEAKPAPTPAPAKPEPKPAAPVAAPKPATPVAAAPKPEPKPAEAAPKPAPKPAASNVGFAVQLGAFADPAAATALRDKARAAGLSAFTETIKTAEGPRTRVRVGPVADRADAEKLRAQAQAKLGVGGMVRPHP